MDSASTLMLRNPLVMIIAVITPLFLAFSCATGEQSVRPIERVKSILQHPSPTLLAADITPTANAASQQSQRPIDTAKAQLIVPSPTNQQPTDAHTTPFWDGELIACTRLNEGETHQVSPGTFILGPVKVDGVQHYSRQEKEGTVLFFEKEASVFAQWGADCYQGSIYFLNSLSLDEFTIGCETGCSSVRMVVIRSDKQEEVQCIYPEGNTKKLEDDGPETWCP